MHQLRLFEMLVGRPSAVLIDLAMILIFFTATVGLLTSPAKPAGILGFNLPSRLLGI